MIWNTLSNEESLFLWKKLRDDIAHLSLIDKLTNIAKFCSTMPFGSRTIDYYSPLEWPTPWEILYYKSFCTSSISILIYYTLTLISIEESIELILVEDNIGIYLLPLIDNRYVLNYELGHICEYLDIRQDFSVLKQYSQDKIRKIV